MGTLITPWHIMINTETVFIWFLLNLKVGPSYVKHSINVKKHNIMSLLRDMTLMSRDKSVDLTGVLSCRATLFECLRHNLSPRQVSSM